MSIESQHNYTPSTTKKSQLRKLQTLIESDRFIMLSPTESEEVTYRFFNKGFQLLSSITDGPVKNLYIKTGYSPKRYFYKHGDHIESLIVDQLFGKSWSLCKNLKRIFINKFNECDREFLLHNLPKKIEEIHFHHLDYRTVLRLAESYPKAKIIVGTFSTRYDMFNDLMKLRNEFARKIMKETKNENKNFYIKLLEINDDNFLQEIKKLKSLKRFYSKDPQNVDIIKFLQAATKCDLKYFNYVLK